MFGIKLSDSDPKNADQPLSLTVHAVPSPQESVAGDERRTLSGRWKMMLVLLVCAAPVVASYFTYYVVRPDSARSFGQLIDPQRTTPDIAATTLQGQALNLRQLKGQWLIVTVAGGACDAQCEQNLYLQRQLREVLGKEKDRVDRVWLVDDEVSVPEKIMPGLQAATVLRVARSKLQKWLAPAPGQVLADHLYVIDPMGNWMMRFPARLTTDGAAKAKRDLERLLRASASWDQAGR